MPLSTRSQLILEAFDAARRATPRLPALDIAQRLGISEGALQAARLGRDVISLPLSPAELAHHLHTLGRVKALTRSSAAVLAQEGRYPAPADDNPSLLLAPGGPNLRLRLAQWHWVCLIRDELPGLGGPARVRHSLQVFDRHGRALHKLFSLEPWPLKSWQTLETRGTTHAPAFTQLAAAPRRELPSAPGLADDWARLRDAHQFFPLLRRHGLARHEANALLEGRFTRRLRPASVAECLTRAAEPRLPIRLCVASPGCVQSHRGPLPRPERCGGWLNLFGDDVTLHLDDAAIHTVWQVHKPGRDGGATSLEAFSEDGELLLKLAATDREHPERAAWRHLLASLNACEAAA